MNVKQILKLLAPYFAVGVFWCIFSNAWLAIFAYHIQILIWSRHELYEMRRPSSKRIMLIALPTVVAGPLLYFLLPYITHVDLSAWLKSYHLSGTSFLLMIPYFGLIHPLLEQMHWHQLREETVLSHPTFAGYHILVLFSLLTIPWLLLCFAVLMVASVTWQYAARFTRSLAVPTFSHILADLGVVLAAWVRIQ
jgi:membrane protease YdiL (CAAX protease family)